MKVGLVLEGGGMRGMYTSAILDRFLDENIKCDEIIGVSAGTLFGVNYLSKQRGRSLRYNKKYANKKNYMSIWSLIFSGNIVNKKFAFYTIPQKLDVFDDEEFMKSDSNFYATITNVDTGKAEYIKLNSVFEDMEVLRATSAMPYVSKMVKYNNKKYLDGGVGDSIPVNKILDMGCDKVIVVLTRPLGYRKKESNKIFAKLFYNRYPNLVKAINERYKNYNEELDLVKKLEDDGKIFVIRPSKTIKIHRTESDENKLQELYDLGINDINLCLSDLKKYLNE